jgi:hypothetical protein
LFIFQIDFDGISSIGPRASKARSAQFNLFSLPNIARADSFHEMGVSAALLARPVLGHTVKDLFRGD